MKSTIFRAIFATCILKTVQGSAPEKDWWETTTIYQVYPRSFKDSDGDGIGDLNGIYEKLDYIKDIGIESIWIQPFYKSPMADLGYDVANYREIEPMFGTMADFKRLIAAIHDRGMKLIMDFVPNHVSDDSEWFKKSAHRIEPYTDFFIWADAKGYNDETKQRVPPNNWLSIFGGPAWGWNEKRQQFYYQQFSSHQPDLNFRSPKVRETMKDVLRFWLDMGVDGFRIDAIRHLFEKAHLKDEPYISKELEGSTNYNSLNHTYTTDQEEDYDVMHEWRLVVDEYKEKDGKTRMLATEAYTPTMDLLIRYYGNETHKGAHIPFYFGLVDFDYQTNATELDRLIHRFIDVKPPTCVANWVVNNHDNPRLASRTTPEFVDAMNMIELLLPGVATIYYGDEIGMQDMLVRKDQTKDPNNRGCGWTETRDGERTPMQWDNTISAGFTTHKKPWLPIHSNYWYKNVQKELETPRSHLNVFKRLMHLRRTPVIKNGDLQTCVLNDWMHMYVRKLEGEDLVVVIVNLGSESEAACAKDCIKYLPDVMKVHTSSINSAYLPGDNFAVTHDTKTVCSVLRPKAGVVLVGNSSSTSDAVCIGSSLIMIFSLAFLLFNRF